MTKETVSTHPLDTAASTEYNRFRFFIRSRSNESVVPQCVGHHRVLYVIKQLLHSRLIRGARQMRENGVGRTRILSTAQLPLRLRLELHRNVLRGLLVLVLPFVFGEAHRQRLALNLLTEQIALIQKQNDRRESEIARIGDDTEQIQRLRHRIQLVLLEQILIVTAQTRHEQNAVDAIELVNPFTALRPLTAHVIDIERRLFDRERLRAHSRRAYSREQNVLLRWDVRRV